MWNLALLAAPGEQLDSARYFETAERPQYDKVTNIFVMKYLARLCVSRL